MTVVVGWLDPGTVQGGFAVSMANMVAYSTVKRLLGGIQRWQSGPHVERGRNGLVKDFLQSDGDWLLQIDSDMMFRHDALEVMLDAAADHGAQVVTGLCFGYTQDSGPFPTIGYWQDDGKVKWPARALPDSPVWCEVTGCAMLMVHRDVFNSVGPDPFDRIEDSTGVLLGEDISFCRRLTDSDIAVLVEPRAETGHVKQFTWDKESHAKYREEEADG